MSYAVRMSPRAFEDVAKLPEPVRAVVLEYLPRMASQPSVGSRPSSAPYPPGMLHRADLPCHGATCLLDVIFQYGADEQTLHIEYVFVEYA